MKFFTKEVQIALVAIVGIVVLFFGMQFLKGLSMLSKGNTYQVLFNDVTGLSASSPVYVNGVKVGTVEAIDCNYSRPDHIVATVALDDKLAVSRGTTAEIVSDLLGNVRLELKLGTMGNGLLAAGDTISGGQQQGLMGKAAGMVPQIEQLLPKIDSILTSVNALLADPALKHSLHNIEDITGGLTTASQELSLLSAQMNRQLPGVISKADGVMANADTLTHNLNQLDLQGVMAKVQQTLTNVEQMTAKLNSNQGTLGLLMRDASLYDNLNSTVRHADSLMIDLKSHPKRYIHFSVFGKKDK